MCARFVKFVSLLSSSSRLPMYIDFPITSTWKLLVLIVLILFSGVGWYGGTV